MEMKAIIEGLNIGLVTSQWKMSLIQSLVSMLVQNDTTLKGFLVKQTNKEG
jgi:hypothetical protein